MSVGIPMGLKQAIVLASVVGVIDPTCTLENICQTDYTELVRPSTYFTNNLKREQMEALGLKGDPSSFEEDHIIPLELCGASHDPKNLMPEPWPQARKKDVMETRFHRLVCKGKVKLDAAQKEIVKYE